MKNKLLKGAHLSERKCREILELFCDDLTATQIAEISGVSRVTVNSYFKLIRNRIASYCGKKHTFLKFDTGGQVNGEVNHAVEEQAYYGFTTKQGAVYTHWLKDIDDGILRQLDKRPPVTSSTRDLPPVLKDFHAIADCDAWNLHWLRTTDNIVEGDDFLTEINGFWQHTRGRLQKFRGMNKKMLYLHIKECEFRYNYRNDELFPLLMNIINTPGAAYGISSERNQVR